jgi:DNA-damage-inducible protein D
MKENNLINIDVNKIRKIWQNEEWYFSVVDIVGVLTDANIPRNYWSDMKRREKQLHESCVQLKLPATDGKNYKTDCANTEGVFRIIMSIPSPKAEPLKLWLAEQGKRTIEETENPELLVERQMEIYKAKGYSDEWIKERIQNIQARKRLTEEWQKRGVKDGEEYSILTATIAKGTFGLTPSEHKEIKGLTKPNENLRDHMTPLELIFTSLGEELTRLNAINDDAQGFHENHDAAVKGGYTAGEARKRVEKIDGKKVVSTENFLKLKNDKTDDKEITEGKDE